MGAHKNTPVPILPWLCNLRKTEQTIRFNFALALFSPANHAKHYARQYHIRSVWQQSETTGFPDPLAPLRHEEFSI